MFSTPSDDATELSQNQIAYYRLDQPSFEFQDELDSSRAKILGISKEEYMSRRQQYNNLEKLDPCRTRIKGKSMDDLDTREFRECINSRLKMFGLMKE